MRLSVYEIYKHEGELPVYITRGFPCIIIYRKDPINTDRVIKVIQKGLYDYYTLVTLITGYKNIIPFLQELGLDSRLRLCQIME